MWGDLANVRFETGATRLGAVNGIVCGDLMDAHLFDNLMPAPGQVDFFLARETGQPDYGSSTSGLARLADSGDCP